MAKKQRKRFETEDGNLEMIKNSVKAIEHHSKELNAELKKNPEIEAWVLAKTDRAAQNLADVTHYLDGKYKWGGKVMAKGGNVKTLSSGLRRYYVETFPTDDMGTDINPKATFRGLYKALEEHKDVYEYIGVGDSLVRERLFAELAEIKGVKYNTIYDMWMGYSKGGKTPIVRTQFEEEEFEYKKGGKLIGGQKKLDLNKNGKLDAQDFKMLRGEKMADGGELTLYKIQEREKSRHNKDWSDEKFQTGGNKYTSYKEAQDIKKKLSDMVSSVEYRVVKVEDKMAKGGKVKRKRWIQDALSGDHKGALRETAKRKGLLKGDENLSKTDLKKLEKMGGKTARRARLAETLREFKK